MSGAVYVNLSDPELASAGRAMLGKESDIAPGQVHLQVRDHDVTLTGTVECSYQRYVAVRCLHLLGGVGKVTNLIEVRGPSASQPRHADVAVQIPVSIEHHRADQTTDPTHDTMSIFGIPWA